MLNFAFYIISSAILILVTSSCDSEIPLPQIEECTMLSNVATCTDKRLPKDDQNYDREFSDMRAYQCTSPADYAILQKDIDEKRAELAKLRRQIESIVPQE